MARKTALYANHVALGARMVDFGGWEMPLQYAGVLAEHAAVRSACGMFDTSHMDAIWIEGPDSLDALSRTVTQDLRTLAEGACRYGFLLAEDAGVQDDLIVYRIGEDAWMAVVNAATAEADFAWIREQCDGTGTAVHDLRGVQGKLDVQGPEAAATVQRLFGVAVDSLRRFRWLRATVRGATWLVSRTGYTGEDGVEIYAPHDAIRAAWETLREAGVQPCGLGARDTLRLEAGLPLYGHELDRSVSPAEAGLMRYCAKAEPFVGRDALLRRAEAPGTRLVPFRLDGRQTARSGQAVRLTGGEEVGRVTSGSFGPTAGQALGFAYVLPPYARPDTRIFVDNGRTLLAGAVTQLPFLRKEFGT